MTDTFNKLEYRNIPKEKLTGEKWMEKSVNIGDQLSQVIGIGEVLYENVENMFRGWMGSFYKLLSRKQRENLIRLYEDLFDKTVTVVNKKLVIFDRSPQNIIQEV